MASIRYSQIRVHTNVTINYIANMDKMVSAKVHDVHNVHNVLSYMGEPESTARVYSFARHCSTNPALAAQQMELYRAKYFESKDGGVQGRADGKGELLGLHFFLSYTAEDDPSEETMNDIITKLAEHPLLRDYAVFGANHFDKKHKHTHFYACQYSAVGKPHKMCMKIEDFNNLRREANRLCVAYGLSIIDLDALRYNDQEYSDWIDGVIADGIVVVHPEREEHKGAQRQKANTRQIYYRHLKEQEEFNAEQERLLTTKQLGQKRAREKYFMSFDVNEDKPKRYYPVSGKQNRYYAVAKYDEFGRERSLLELIVILILVIYENEMKFKEVHLPQEYETIKVKVDPKVQGAYNCVRTAREMNIEHPSDIPKRIADVGKQMNALKAEKKRHESSIVCHENIISAWEQFNRVQIAVEDADNPDVESLNVYKEAYAVLVKNQILTQEAFEYIKIRYDFEKQKVVDYDKRLSKLKKQYHDLKKLDALIAQRERMIEAIYIRDQIEKGQLTLDEKIRAAEGQRSFQRTEACNMKAEQKKHNKEDI